MTRASYDIGYKFSNCEVMKFVCNDGHNRIFECKCHCGKLFNCKASEFRNRKSCGCNYYKKYCGDMSGGYWSQLRIGATVKRNLEFTITKQYIWDLFIQQNGLCVYTKQKLSWGTPGRHLTGITASLDRIDNNKGYVIGNVQWVHKDINIMKRTLTHESFINICNLIAKNHPRLVENGSCIL